MPATFDKARHGLDPLRVEVVNGLVFGTFSDEVPPFPRLYRPGSWCKTWSASPGASSGCSATTASTSTPTGSSIGRTPATPTNATILHAWATKLKLNRFTMEGAIEMSPQGWHHLSWSKMATDQGGEVYDTRAFRSGSANFEQFGLHDPSVIEQWDDYGDGITTAIQTAFPNFVLQQIHNTLATRVLIPRGPEGSELVWTILGYADDDEEKTNIRLKQGNLIGPSGYISLEDGMVGNFVQRGVAGDKDKAAVMEMDGTSIETIRGSRASECGVRGFWTAYRSCMGV